MDLKKVEDEAANTEEKVQFLDNKNVKFLRHDKLFKIVLFGDAGCVKERKENKMCRNRLVASFFRVYRE